MAPQLDSTLAHMALGDTPASLARPLQLIQQACSTPGSIEQPGMGFGGRVDPLFQPKRLPRIGGTSRETAIRITRFAELLPHAGNASQSDLFAIYGCSWRTSHGWDESQTKPTSEDGRGSTANPQLAAPRRVTADCRASSRCAGTRTRSLQRGPLIGEQGQKTSHRRSTTTPLIF